MRSCGLWLELMALLHLIKIPPVYCQRTDDYRLTPFLVAIKSNDSGLEVRTLFPENLASVGNSGTSQSWPSHVAEPLEPQMKFIPGYNLSSKCGDEYYRCQELLVVNDSSHNNGLGLLSIVFVPLETGVLLLRFWYDSNAITVLQWNASVVNSSNCTPTVFYKINGKFYMVCISSYYEEHLIYNATVYEVRLNISGSGMTLAEKTTVNVNNISDSLSDSNVSNFIIVEQRIYFAIGSTIVALDILDSTQTKQYPELSDCPQVDKLVESVSAGNQKVPMAYCTDRYILYNPVYGDWDTRFFFSSSGVPYVCPNNSYRATLFTESGILQFLVRGVLSNTINNTNVSSGICFESQNTTYFAYSAADQQYYSVYVYDFIRQIHYPVSTYFCLHIQQECPQLFILDNQYLVIQDIDSDRDHILDTKTNFSLIFNISSGTADILAVLHSNISAVTPSPPIYTSTSGIIPSPPSTTTESAPSSTNIVVTSAPKYTHTPTSPSSVTVHTSSTATTASPDTSGLPRANLVGIIVTVVIGLFVIIVILIMVAIRQPIQQCREKKWYTRNVRRIPRLRFRRSTDQSALLASDSAREEEDNESLEMESRARQLGWRITKL